MCVCKCSEEPLLLLFIIHQQVCAAAAAAFVWPSLHFAQERNLISAAAFLHPANAAHAPPSMSAQIGLSNCKTILACSCTVLALYSYVLLVHSVKTTNFG